MVKVVKDPLDKEKKRTIHNSTTETPLDGAGKNGKNVKTTSSNGFSLLWNYYKLSVICHSIMVSTIWILYWLAAHDKLFIQTTE